MVTQVKCVVINERLLVLPTSLLGFVTALAEPAINDVRNVKKPETDRKEHELDEVGDEEAIVAQQLLRHELGPGLQFLFLHFPQECFNGRQARKIEEEHIYDHEYEIAVKDGYVPLRSRLPVLNVNHQRDQARDHDDRHKHRRQRGDILIDRLLAKQLVL